MQSDLPHTLPPAGGYVASVHPLATDAGLEALRKGGNAIDAAIAVGLTLGVVDGHNSGIGGGCFMLMRLSDGSLYCIDGRGTAPAKAHRDMYIMDGQLHAEASQTGAMACTVPGALATYADAHTRHGRLPWSAAFQAGIHLAKKGFPIDAIYEQKLKLAGKKLALDPEARTIFFDEDEGLLKEGDTLTQYDLAKSYHAISEHGAAWFYEKSFPQVVGSYMHKHGGLLCEEDFRRYKALMRKPIQSMYRDHIIVGTPPASSGGVMIAQMLNMLENFNLDHYEPGSTHYIHLITEVMKLTFADHSYWLGDAGFTTVPEGLLDKNYAAELAKKIDLHCATRVSQHGEPSKWQTQHFSKRTTHFSVTDHEGNWVACTATVNTTFGAKIIVPGTGILLNNEMDDFSLSPGQPNHFNLIGSEANSIAAGKRPLSCMSPTLVLNKDAAQPVLSLGAAGGPAIITQTLLALLGVLQYDMTPEQTLSQARFHHQWKPDAISIERAMPESTRVSLRNKGHVLEEVDRIGVMQMIQLENGQLHGASDPRVYGKAAGTEN